MAASMRFDLTAARRAWRAGLVALVAVPSVLILGLVPLPALAHKSSDAYLFIDVQPDRSGSMAIKAALNIGNAESFNGIVPVKV